MCPLLEAVQRWVSPGHLFLGICTGVGTEAPGQNLSHPNQHPRAMFNSAPFSLIRGGLGLKRHAIQRFGEGLLSITAAFVGKLSY